jgi:putative hydrolase of the HAD superfamily
VVQEGTSAAPDRAHLLLVVMLGRVASGKSSVARELARRLGAVRIEGDLVRADLLSADSAAVHEVAEWRTFTPGFAREAYQEFFRRAERALVTGHRVVLDACFARNADRLAARALARKLGVPFILVECRASEETIHARLAARDQTGGTRGWEAIHDDLLSQWEPLAEIAEDECVTARSEGPLDVCVATVLEAPAFRHVMSHRDLLAREHPLLPAAVTFDCWNTLLYEDDWGTAHALRVDELRTAAREAGREVPRETADRAFRVAWGRHMDTWTEGSVTGAREVALWALDELGLHDPHPALEHLTSMFEEASHSGRVLALEGARDTLEALARRNIPCALVCDTGLTPGRVVRRHLARLGLLDGLAVQIFSDEVGVPKPDPRMFRAALEPLDVNPERALHVGDLRRTDVAGAYALGMTTVRIRDRHDDEADLPDGDHVVDSHAELAALLQL